MTLLEETKSAIESQHQSVDDIIFIGSEYSGHSCTWDEFTTLADFEYDSGYGWQKVAKDLVIVFRDMTMLYREEYDGSEWWGVRAALVMPEETHPITCLGGNDFMWDSLEDMNKQEVMC